VILDWGFWTKRERDEARAFYAAEGIPAELHYLDIPREEWLKRIAARNRAVLTGEADAYYVDDGLRAKFEAMFEVPSPDEIAVRVGTEK
jgi:predicted kinase